MRDLDKSKELFLVLLELFNKSLILKYIKLQANWRNLSLQRIMKKKC